MQKMNMALIQKGHHLHMITSKLCPFTEQYKTWTCAHDIEQLIESFRIYSKCVDFLHAHNEPSYYVSVWKEITNKPVILDVHDSFLARSTPQEAEEIVKQGRIPFRVSIDERNNFQLADALIFPSEPFKNLICGEFKLTQPTLVLPSYTTKMHYEYTSGEWLGGLAYGGKVQLEMEKEGRYYQYCNYIDLADKSKEIGLDFHLYSGRDEENKDFQNAYKNAIIHKPLTYPKFIQKLGRHDWGLVGNTNKSSEWRVAFPNKLFDYIAAGLPIVAINAPEVGQFIRQHDIGIEVDSLEELCARWREHREKRSNLIKKRYQFSMDNNIHYLEDFYKKVVQHGC
jgi:glycosyltransferase involved in cell wall biosynthesis